VTEIFQPQKLEKYLAVTDDVGNLSAYYGLSGPSHSRAGTPARRPAPQVDRQTRSNA